MLGDSHGVLYPMDRHSCPVMVFLLIPSVPGLHSLMPDPRTSSFNSLSRRTRSSQSHQSCLQVLRFTRYCHATSLRYPLGKVESCSCCGTVVWALIRECDSFLPVLDLERTMITGHCEAVTVVAAERIDLFVLVADLKLAGHVVPGCL